jgi:hypothetical protein
VAGVDWWEDQHGCMKLSIALPLASLLAISLSAQIEVVSDGKVGIGTTSPVHPLHVEGNIYSTSGVIGSTLWVSDSVRKISASTDLLFRSSAGTPEMVIDDSGKVGIGTSSPDAKLEIIGGASAFGLIVEGDGSAANARIALRRANDTAATGNIDWLGNTNAVGARIGVNDDVGGSMAFKLGGSTAGHTRLLISSAGHVGIGTTSPAARLHIHQSSGGVNQLTLDTGFSGGNAIALNPFITGINNGGFEIRDVANSASRLVVLPTSGNIGIGTTAPAQKLEVAGSVKATSFISSTTTYADFVFKPNYRLPALREVEAHINEHGHLPGIPSEAQARAEGIDLAAMQVKLLQKVEELTLHAIAAEKRANEQEQVIADLRAQVARLSR